MGEISPQDRQLIQSKLDEVKIALGEISECLKRNIGNKIITVPLPHPLPPFPEKPGVCYPIPVVRVDVTAEDFSIGINIMDVWTVYLRGLV